MDNYGYLPDDNNGRPYAISTISRVDSGVKQVTSNEFLVGVNSRFKPVKNPVYYQRATIILAILVVILLIGLLIILVLHSKSTSYKICTTNECLRSAANLKYSIDFSVDPCDNFYEFCCGKWSKEHPNHGWYSSFSTFTTVTEKIVIESLDILDNEVEDDEPKSVSQAKWFYQSCLNTDEIDSLGLTPLYEYIKMVNLPVIPNFFNKTLDVKTFQFDWAKVEAKMKIVLAMDSFIGFTVQPNIFRRNENVIYLGVLYQSCPLPSPLKKKYVRARKPWKRILTGKRPFSTLSIDDVDEDYTNNDDDEKLKEVKMKIRSNIIKYVIKEIMKNNSRTEPEPAELQRAADVINSISYYMDDLTANYSLPEGDGGEDETRNVTFKHLQDLTDKNVKTKLPDFWMNYVSYIFKDTNITINATSDCLFITDTEIAYLWHVLQYVSSQPAVDIELYLWWSTIYAMIINTSSEITEYIEHQAASYRGSTSDESVYVRSRSLDCCELVNQYMGWAVSYAVADKTFANRTKPKVEKMINDIKDSFVEHVHGLSWMDDPTKEVTLEKSEEMRSFVGYPDWLFKEGALDKKYPGLDINSTTYLRNMINTILLYTTETLSSLREPNPRDWSSEAITVNAYNSFMDNAINVPMAILNYPLYDLGLEVLNYGSIGSILGHELTHGFDNTGRKHDKYGNYVQWWSNKTIETFENMTQCFIKQYDNFTIDGIDGHIKGKVTLGENLADNGGLHQAYTAYTRYRKQHGREPKLPGFEVYSSDQLFFIAYGSIWCETSTLEDLKSQLEYDEHCPNAIRVIGTLQNSEEFSKAFKCPKNSFMNPDTERCKIW